MGTNRRENREDKIRYTNAMRQAIRTIRNPSPVPVDIAVYSDHIGLRVSSTKVLALETSKRVKFLGYLNHMGEILESFGVPVEIEGFPFEV